MATGLKFLLAVIFSISLSTAFAQTKPAANKPGTFKKFTPPKLTSFLGIRSDTATVFKEEAVQLVKLPLKITDDKKAVYTVTSYHFMYRKRAVTEDEENGKVTPIVSTVGDRFTVTPLPALWSNIIAEDIKPGEELLFFDIIVKDAQGRIMYAPTLTIKVK